VAVKPFDEAGVERALTALVEELDLKPGKLYQPIRVAITGTTISPRIFESVALRGKDQTLARIDQALERAARD
jgi:glutamyl/glutaminyl-tRNA synthetase